LWIVPAAVLLCCGLAAGQEGGGQAGQAAKGQLRVLGDHVERLVLVGEGTGTEETFSGDALKGGINLAPGTYRVRELVLKGGYRRAVWEGLSQVKVAAGGVAELKAGAPLTQGLTVEHQGKMLVLRHELRGVGGERYLCPEAGAPPEFVVYKGERKVGGGRFEFG